MNEAHTGRQCLWQKFFSHGGRAEDHGEHGVGDALRPLGPSDYVFTVVLRSSSVRKYGEPRSTGDGFSRTHVALTSARLMVGCGEQAITPGMALTAETKWGGEAFSCLHRCGGMPMRGYGRDDGAVKPPGDTHKAGCFALACEMWTSASLADPNGARPTLCPSAEITIFSCQTTKQEIMRICLSLDTKFTVLSRQKEDCCDQRRLQARRGVDRHQPAW